MRTVIILLVALTLKCHSQIHTAKHSYNEAYKELKGMLTDSIPLSFKRSVFIVENAYVNNLSYDKFEKHFTFQAGLCKQIAQQNPVLYSDIDRDQVNKYAAVFRLMTDSVRFNLDSGSYFVTNPYVYDFDDFLGEQKWEKMFLSKLITSHSGNCHSLPFYYKILCEELGVKAYLAMAPNHIYIKLKTRKTGWFNTELTSKYFPLDAWVMASGYINLTAVQNRIYMDTLSQKQSIALCVIDLAKGYERKFQGDLDFVEKCTDLALHYYPNYVNALILKAETKKKRFEQMMIDRGVNYATELFSDPKAKKSFDEMEQLYVSIHQLGYRMMPKEMYVSWLAQLNKERSKYANKEILNDLTPKGK